MVVALASRLLAAWFAYLLPAYAPFKVLSRRPPTEQDLQRCLVYWTVLGAFLALESALEWIVSWTPFYWELKTLFLLFLCLPQTQGSTYIYTAYLEPFFTRNQAELDKGIVSVQTNAVAFIQAQLAALWALLTRQSQSASQAQSDGTRPNQLSQLAWVSASARQVLQSAGLSNLFPAANGDRPAPSRNQSAESTNSSSSANSGPAFPVPEYIS